VRVALLPQAGPPSAFRIEDLPTPEIGDDDVLVRVMACGVSQHDVAARAGIYRRGVVFPIVLGMEIAGVVETVGAAVTDLVVGDRVCTKAFASCGRCSYCRNGRETTCRQRRAIHGGYAEFAALPQDAVVKVPEGLPFEVACVMGPGAGVALNAVRDTAHVTLGETVLVTGASGGVGLPAVQLARHAGARVIAVSRSGSKRDMLLQAGAHEVLIADADENFGQQVRDMTGGEGVEVVIDTVGSTVFDAAFDSLAPHGRYAFVGQLAAGEIRISPARIFFKRAQLLGVGSVSRVQLRDVIALAEAGVVKPRIDRILPLDRIVEAHELVESGRSAGRIVIAPNLREAA
jgi:NADPH:quinone reductase-like Zn-dependent oxidoreductase